MIRTIRKSNMVGSPWQVVQGEYAVELKLGVPCKQWRTERIISEHHTREEAEAAKVTLAP